MTDIRIAGTANLQQMRAQFQAINAEVAKLNSQLAATMMAGGQRVNPQGYRTMQRQTRIASQEFRDAAASSGQFYTQQLRLNTATEQYTEKLKKQNLTFKEIRQNRKIMYDAYVDQIRMQNMIVRENRNLTTSGGKTYYDLAIPKNIHEDLDSVRNRLGWLNAELASGSRQMVNWGKNTQWAGRQLMVGFTMPVAAFGAATGVLAYTVDKEMTRIKKVYDTTAQAVAGDTESMKKVNMELAQLTEDSMNTARTAAREYGISVQDTLSVQAELAATGQRGEALQKSTIESLRLAALGELDYQQAASTTIALQTAFKLSTQELTEAFNFMNATENATSLTIQDIAEATPRAASAMSALGVSVEQMTVLLTSMKESGVDAAEAANALKSATGTILAPSPAAQEFIDQITGGTLQVSKLAEEADGNLYVALQKLSQGMEGLSQYQKQQILVKLFGKYQFNRVSAMLYNLEDAFNGTANQTAKAMELMGEDSKTLADTADMEMKRYQESVSGRFKTALESVKIELAEMGKPFLEVATIALGMAENFANWFNGLPDGIKKFAALSAIVVAALGPIIMLAGLFGNLIGNIGLGAAAVLGFITKFNILNKSEWATQKSLELANSGFVKQGTAVELLTSQVNALTASLNEARNASVAAATAPGMKPGTVLPNGSTFLGMPTMPSPALNGNPPANRTIGPMTYDQTLRAAGVNPNATKQADRQALQNVEKRLALTARQQGIEATIARVRAQSEAQSLAREEALNNARQKGADLVSGTSMAVAAMSASTLLMMQPWSEMGQDVGQFVLIATLVVPALKTMVGLVSVAKVKYIELAASARLAAAAQASALGTTSKTAAAAGTLRAGLAGAAGAAGAIMGPLGWAALAIGGGIFALNKWNQKQEEITKEQVKQNNAMYDQRDTLEEILGLRERELDVLQRGNAKDGGRSETFQLSDKIKNSDNEETKTLVDSVKDAEGYEASTIAATSYLKVLNATGGSAEKAKQYVEALWIASAKGTDVALAEAQKMYDFFGSNPGADDMATYYNALFDNILGDNVDSIKKQGANIGAIFADGLANGADPMAMIEHFQDNINEQMFAPMAADIRESLAAQNLGVTDMASFKEFYEGYKSGALSIEDIAKNTGMSTQEALANVTELMGMLNVAYDDHLADIKDGSKAIAQTLAAQLHFSQEVIDGINSLEDLMIMPEFVIATGNEEDAMAMVEQQIRDASKYALQYGRELTDEQKLAILNAARLARGMEETNNFADGLGPAMGDGANEAARMAREVSKIPGYISVSVNFTGEEAKQIYQSGMEGVMNDMSDMASDRFDSSMDNAISNAEAQGDAAMDRLENQQEAAMNAFENRWERRRDAMEKAYDTRVENIEKEIEAEQKAEELRQKIFQNELDRIARLNEEANRNIDFNVALNSGDFDEAARIRNDMQAAADQGALERAMDAGSGKSEKRVSKLEDRKEGVEEAREKAMKALEAREEAERNHLEKMQEMRKNALQEQTDAEVDAMRQRWEEDKDSLDDRLTLFKSYTARNQKDLERWMKVVGLSYDDFGIDVKDKGDAWSKYFRSSLSSNIRQAGTEIMSDKMWEAMGGDVAKDLLGGALDMSWAQFKHWMATGEFKTGGYRPDKPNTNTGQTTRTPNNTGQGPQETAHSGGEIGSGINNRTGVARTLRGLHSSEVMVRAQKGEYMIDRDTMAQHGDLIRDIHNGKMDRSRRNVGYGEGGAGPGVAGIFGAIAASLMKATIMRAMLDQAANKKTRGAAGAIKGVVNNLPLPVPTGGATGAGGWRKPSVPGKGWGNTHDYHNGLGSPLYAYNDGVVVDSRAITSGGSPGNGKYATPYRSYGETIAIRGVDGNVVRYAHLSPGKRFVSNGQKVKGGQLIGLSGMTGNATGPHTHFDVNGSYLAQPWFASHGIGLKSGGYTTKDGMANLHKQEVVIDPMRTKNLFASLDDFKFVMGNLADLPSQNVNVPKQDNVAVGGNTEYNVEVNLYGANLDVNDVANAVEKKFKKMEARRPGGRSK